jgi:hypothetical protein
MKEKNPNFRGLYRRRNSDLVSTANKFPNQIHCNSLYVLSCEILERDDKKAMQRRSKANPKVLSLLVICKIQYKAITNHSIPLLSIMRA